MEIYNDLQYNQAIGKYKLLSSNAGVGSIITTKAGFFVMPQSVSLWECVKAVNKYIENHKDDFDINSISRESGVDIINDPRFIEFLKKEQKITNLRCLINVPILNLTERNYPKHKDHPLFIKFKAYRNAELSVEHFIIPAIHFPRWFYSNKMKTFKELSDWKKLWKENQCNGGDLKYFAPPRDPFSKTNRKFKDNNKDLDFYDALVQIPMLLICKNGHISDIPWYQLFCAGIDGHKKDMDNEEGFDLFGYNCQSCSHGNRHELQWIENRNQSESWGVIKCKSCGHNFSLEGIMNIKPFCSCETPWNGIGTKSKKSCKLPNGTRTTMQFVLSTSNSVYYADSFSSLYIPRSYLKDKILDSKQQKVLLLINEKLFPKAQSSNNLLTKEEFIQSINLIDKADDLYITITEIEAQNIIRHFLQKNNQIKDVREQYRFEEFSLFSNNSISSENSNFLEFKDIQLPEKLKPFFRKIQQINILSITNTQLGFNRVSFPNPKRINGEVVRELGQTIFSEENKEDVVALPANQIFGEGLFFEFDRELINSWDFSNKALFSLRYNQDPGEIGKTLKDELDDYGASMFYLIHTFSHLILKELEFSCGYPTASLKERLYYSDRMCGILIYTADGSEGSMGGLVWQGQPQLIERIIISALERANNCSSDPLCWEAGEQLNLAACFSCCLVSETSCEQRNLGLDRRALVDEDFGFFRSLITIGEKEQEWLSTIICDRDHLQKFRDDMNKALGSISIAETLGVSKDEGCNVDEHYKGDQLCINCPYKLSFHCKTCLFILQGPLERKLYLKLTREGITFKTQYGLDRNGKQISVIGKDYNNPDNNFKNVLTVVDFYVEKKNQGLCIYTDGYTYHERTEAQAQRDKNIDRQLQIFGHTVYRYTGKDINENMEKTIREIKKWIEN